MDITQQRIKKYFIVIQILAFGSFASMNYYNVYLRAIGFDSTQIGLWGSINGIIALLTVPIWGILADKIGSPKKLYMLAMSIFAIIYAVLPTIGKMTTVSFLPLYALIILYSTVVQPTHTMQDSWMVGTCRVQNLNYASIRSWGSFGFGIIAISYGFLTQYFGLDFVFYMAPVLIFPIIFVCQLFSRNLPNAENPATENADKKTAANAKLPKVGLGILFKNYYLMTAFLMTIVLASYSALITPFFPFILEHAGVPANRFGWISGYGALVQVVAMFIFTKFAKKVPLSTVLIIAGFFGVAENIMYALASNLWMLFISSTLWGFAMAMYVTVLPMYIYSLVPRSHSATAISFNATVTMLLSIVGNFTGGVLISTVGLEQYLYGLSIFRLALIFLFIFSLFFGKRVLKITQPDYAAS